MGRRQRPEEAPLERFYEMLGSRDAAQARARAAALAQEVAFTEATKRETAGYTVASLQTIQNCASEDDLRALVIDARNKFGVSLLHKACRYPNWLAARYIAKTHATLSRQADDLGRLPLHDACWNDNINFAVVDVLIDQEPLALLAPDNRGHTPLCYIPKKMWKSWNDFLDSRKPKLVKAFGVAEQPTPRLPTCHKRTRANAATADDEDDDIKATASPLKKVVSCSDVSVSDASSSEISTPRASPATWTFSRVFFLSGDLGKPPEDGRC